jgi:spermidine synthase
MHIVHEDAMVWIAAQSSKPADERFDVVIIDFPDPNNYALGKLYTTRFYALVRARLADGAAMTVQATSPLFARSAYWCIVRTMEAAGLNVAPYHVAVPSFGEWGYVLAKKDPFSPPSAPLLASLRFLDAKAMEALFAFSRDMAEPPVEINRLNNQMLVQYYEREWRKWN